MFYTNVCIQGNTVLERYVDDNGISRSRKVNFGPTLYKHSNNGELKDIYGKPATAVEFDSIGDARRWMKDMRDINREPLGMDDFVLQYLYHTYSGPVSFKYEQIDIAFVDIEVPTDGPFPEPHICDWEIDGICHYSTKRKRYSLFTTRPWDKAKSILDKDDKGNVVDILDRVDYVFCESERELLIRYLKFFRDNTPDVFSGWNSEMFDLRYIVNRYRKVLGDVYANKLSPWEQIIERTVFKDDDEGEEAEEIVTYELLGIACLDYMAAYKKFTFKTRPTYKLDYIGQVELGMKKLELTEKTYLAFSQKNPQRYIDYLIRDVDLLVKLDARLSLMALITSVSYYAKINYNNTFSPLKTWDAIIHNSLIEQGIVVPENKRTSKVKYAGAFVKDPVTAFYRWILSFDLTSLYPHLIMGWNISPETIVDCYDVPRIFVKDRMVPDIVGMGLVDKKFQVPNDDLSFAANGMRYTRKKRGIIPTEIEKVFLQRKAAKNAEFTADKIATIAWDTIVDRKDNNIADTNIEFDAHGIDLSIKGEAFDNFVANLKTFNNESLHGIVDYCRFMEKLENVNQQARKVLINSLYGALGNEHFRYYDVRNAEAITMSGQFAIRWIMRKMNEYMNALCQTKDVDYVVYGDTDSIYLTFEKFVNLMAAKKGIQVGDIETIRWVDFLAKFAKEKCEPYIDQSYRELAEYVQCYDHKLFMDREIIADTAFWTAKKRYAANVWDSEGKRKLDEHGNVVPKLKIMGIETQRSSTPVFAGKSLEKSIKLILTKGEKAMQDYVKEVKAEYPKRDYREIAAVSSANNIEKNHNNWVPVKGCPGHIKGALAYNKVAEQRNLDMIRSGEKIQIVMLKEPNHIHSPVLAFPSGDKIPDEFDLDLSKYLDFMGMYQKHYLKPLENICNAIGWETEKVSSLSDLFGDM
ncbi:DNA polymerase [Aeromonas phage Ah1]|uniref:DNA polymerase n=1 Tax=Aeromonas phage Ah1 TaxID=2053701 RepID=A0A2H4YEG5_9CAUD|nr:DNA polymerase [Aeromonas phage Ah1]AUE22561.1 DNA polymerase [Aeromonas phage Ah1]